jgi:hypothetical protein
VRQVTGTPGAASLRAAGIPERTEAVEKRPGQGLTPERRTGLLLGILVGLAKWNDFPDKARILSISLMSPPGVRNRFVSTQTRLKPGQMFASSARGGSSYWSNSPDTTSSQFPARDCRHDEREVRWRSRSVTTHVPRKDPTRVASPAGFEPAFWP